MHAAHVASGETPPQIPQGLSARSMRRVTPVAGAPPVSVQPSHRPTAPLTSHRHRRVQRAPEQIPTEIRRSMEKVVGTDLSSVRVHRGDDSAETARDLRAAAYTSETEVHIPSHHGSLHSPTASRLLAHELVHVGQQKRFGDQLPEEDSHEGQVLEREAQEMADHWMSGSVQSPGPSAQPPSVSTPATAAPDARPATVGGPQPQRAETTAALSAAGVPGGEASVAQDDDELARRLYDRIRSRLRADLLIDRERAGLIADRR
jgi:hypothetical protein